MNRRPAQSVLLAAALLLAACRTTGPGPVPLNIFAAASLAEAFRALGQQFMAANPGVTVVFNFGGSNQLAQQLGQGAPGDVFASANAAQMQSVIDSGRVLSGAQKTFARNRLVLIFPGDNPAGIRTLQDLARPGLKLILAASEVPAGQYSLDFLDKAGQAAAFGPAFKSDVLLNVVSYEENVRAVLSKVALAEADAGIVYASDLAGSEAQTVGRLDIPDDLNTIASYPIAVIADSAQAGLAQAFVDFVLSAPGQAILAEHGFIPATP